MNYPAQRSRVEPPSSLGQKVLTARASTRVRLLVALAAALLVGIVLYGWLHDAPRRASLACLTRLDAVLHSASREELLDLVILPAAVRQRSAAEQSEFLAKALQNETSPEGLAVLRQRAAYGPLNKLFPAEAGGWAAQAGVSPDDCVAFKLERNGIRAEVVLLKPSNYESEVTHGKAPYRIVRVNNVKQMAHLKSSTAERTP